MGQYKFIILKYNFNRSISSLSLHEKEGEKKDGTRMIIERDHAVEYD